MHGIAITFVIFVVCTTCLALIAQAAGLFLPPYRIEAIGLKIATLSGLASTAFVAFALSFAYTYCESNCPQGINWPTAIASCVMLGMDAWSCWFVFRDIPRRSESRLSFVMLGCLSLLPLAVYFWLTTEPFNFRTFILAIPPVLACTAFMLWRAE